MPPTTNKSPTARHDGSPQGGRAGPRAAGPAQPQRRAPAPRKAPGSTPHKVPAATTAKTARSGLPHTLCFDIGRATITASVLSSQGEPLHEPAQVPTLYPLQPGQLVATLRQLASELPSYQRVSASFPGTLRAGRVLSAPDFISPTGPGGAPSAQLWEAWTGFDLQGALAGTLGHPCRAANEAEVEGAALVDGEGLELVMTLGTGVGTALFWQGKLAPHLDLAHHPLGKKGQDYDELLGEAARRKVGNKKWSARVSRTLEVLRDLLLFDKCYIGGDNASRVKSELPADVVLASNGGGALGGVRLWERL
ncbi:MAG: ROK family protein [Acidimicrobiales bacterium]